MHAPQTMHVQCSPDAMICETQFLTGLGIGILASDGVQDSGIVRLRMVEVCHGPPVLGNTHGTCGTALEIEAWTGPTRVLNIQQLGSTSTRHRMQPPGCNLQDAFSHSNHSTMLGDSQAAVSNPPGISLDPERHLPRGPSPATSQSDEENTWASKNGYTGGNISNRPLMSLALVVRMSTLTKTLSLYRW